MKKSVQKTEKPTVNSNSVGLVVLGALMYSFFEPFARSFGTLALVEVAKLLGLI